ncbi:MAG: FimV/HubP family polar landmark protein [Burkholderiaceae bacterium]
MHRWKFSVLAAAAVASAGFYSGDAAALALGRITVQSALGEPLRAEIDVPQITAAEADTLKVAPAAPEVFKAQGMDYSSALNGLQVQLQRRADGTAFLRLSSDRPVNEPFVDFVLEANWGTGRITRSYTMLFDPPALRRPAPAVTAAAQLPSPSAPTVVAPPPVRAEPAPAAARSPAAPRASAPAPQAPAGGVVVQAGDTAGKLANIYRPTGVSLDQMLVAMLRANPDAFIRGNVHRLKAGAVLQMPDESAAQATSAPEARQILAAQSRDFNAFRRNLAGAAPTPEVAGADRSAAGKVQARVEDRKPATVAPDRLTLSKGAVQGQKTPEDQIAKDKQAQDNASRMAELSKNISDLNKLGAASAPAGTPAAASAPAAPGIAAPVAVATPAAASAPASTPAPAVEASAPVVSAPENPASVPAETASAPAAEAAPAAAAPAAAASVPAQPPVAPPAPVEDPSFLDTLMEDPMVLGGLGLALLALIGYGGYRVVQRRRAGAGVDSSFMESRIQPDSFFGSSGGQRVDTSGSDMTTGSSMAYSPSQLDVGGDVDPVAEADVYLAYGRDLQAEEILKEAVRHNPARVSIHVKLAEIYAKRQDRKALEVVAGEVFKLTQGEGPDWARVAELGRDIDSGNALYQPGGRPGMGVAAVAGAATAAAAAAVTPPVEALPPDLDLDLDLELPNDAQSDPAPAPAPSSFAAAAAAAANALPPEPSLDLNLPSLDSASAPASTEPADLAGRMQAAADELSMAPSGPVPLQADPPDSAPMEFDLGDLSLDLNSARAPMPTVPSALNSAATEPALDADSDDDAEATSEDPLATKLALAEEFNAIGDTDGARTLVEEVVAEATGALRTRAQRLLSELG